ncbi:MAG TPA: hypothetical protein VMI31_17055 [Fimbriimonadaceae bacterium]|nr:hypothetical protein [Fimbriimonadaceae bacterium]
MAERVWSSRAKWAGNLIPVAFMAPFAIAGILLMVSLHQINALGVALCLLSLVAGWLAVNRFGLFGNERLRRQIQTRVLGESGRDASKGIFVGFARPAFVGLLDAHEDLGFLFLDQDELAFIGEVHQATVRRQDVLGVRFRANVHSTLGLGRWVGIEAIHKGKRVRLLVEPREAKTLLGNRKRGTQLRREIIDWAR